MSQFFSKLVAQLKSASRRNVVELVAGIVAATAVVAGISYFAYAAKLESEIGHAVPTPAAASASTHEGN